MFTFCPLNLQIQVFVPEETRQKADTIQSPVLYFRFTSYLF
uniref:Uncharacterized protein n=1 Tax=Rhizophora mucronata TaxID=61149 RepID=A0A2P2N9Z4_RHIMU